MGRFRVQKAPRPGFEPGTYRLTAGRSTVELSRNDVRLETLELTREPGRPVEVYERVSRGDNGVLARCNVKSGALTGGLENDKSSASMELREPRTLGETERMAMEARNIDKGADGGTGELAGMRIAILAETLYEDLELWYPYYRLREAGADVFVVGSGSAETYQSKHG